MPSLTRPRFHFFVAFAMLLSLSRSSFVFSCPWFSTDRSLPCGIFANKRLLYFLRGQRLVDTRSAISIAPYLALAIRTDAVHFEFCEINTFIFSRLHEEHVARFIFDGIGHSIKGRGMAVVLRSSIVGHSNPNHVLVSARLELTQTVFVEGARIRRKDQLGA